MTTRALVDGSPRFATAGAVTLRLAHADEFPGAWVGQPWVLTQVLAAWSTEGPGDLPMHPRLLGKPGVGKTTLAVAAARAIGRPVYLMQATVDTRPEDLLVMPVVSGPGTLTYVASPLVTAMLEGGVCILDEGNRMTEKAWASLAPLLDTRRYVESIVVGVKIHAHPEFRLVATMNDDASTFELPEYIHSRLQPQITLEFAGADEELAILRANLPHTDAEILQWVVRFLQVAHEGGERWSVRDGINVARFAARIGHAATTERDAALRLGVEAVLGAEGLVVASALDA